MFANGTHYYSRGDNAAPIIMAGVTMRGKPNYKDINNSSYVFNGDWAETKNWQGSQKSCSATITSRKSYGNLVGGELPMHSHSNKHLKIKARSKEKAVIDKYANVQGALPSNLLQDLST